MKLPLALLAGSTGAGEILLILFVALLLFGANKLPSIARTLGRTLAELRKAVDEFSNNLRSSDNKHNPSQPSSADSSSTGKCSEERKG